LESAETKDRAWGAWWASQIGNPDLQPLLIRNLVAHISGTTWQDEAVMDASLDAMIQSGADDLPFSLVESVYPRRKAQALILLPKVKPDPALDRFLFELLHEKSRDGMGTEWYVAANLLHQRNVSGFTAAVLEDMTLQGTVLVCDKGQPCDRNGRVGGIIYGDSGGYLATGFPPWVTYAIQKGVGSSRNTFPLVPGPVPMGYSRYVGREGSRPGFIGESRRQTPPNPSTADRMRYIVVDVTLLSDEVRQVIWENNSALDAAVKAFKSDLTKRYSQLLDRLRKVGQLTAEEANRLKTPKVNITFVDLRAVKTPLSTNPR
jgi:hypothetical protein